MAYGDMAFLIFCFAILLVLVGKFAWAPVTKMMATRQEKIDGDLDYADNARQEAQALHAQREAELKNSKADAMQIVQTAKENGEKQRQDIVTAAQTEAQALKQNAEKAIAQSRQDAMDAAKNDIAALSLAIAQKMIAKELDPDTQQALIANYIQEIGEGNGSH